MALRPPGGADVAAAIGRYAPRSLGPDVAAFARTVVEAAEPKSTARAKALLFAAGRLGTFATSVGVELDPSVVLSASLIERFIITQGAALGVATRRTVRSNLRFLSAACVANAPPAPVPLSRERAKAPYSSAEIEAYLALADTQPTRARAMRLSGLIALGAGAGLMGADLRTVAGTDVVARSGGVVVEVKGRRARVVPVLARYHERVLASASFARAGYVTGGFSAQRRNVTAALKAGVAGGADLPVLDTGRLRATWLLDAAGAIGLKAFMDAAGITCSQRLGDLVATLATCTERDAVALLGGTP
jgi:integrase